MAINKVRLIDRIVEFVLVALVIAALLAGIGWVVYSIIN